LDERSDCFALTVRDIRRLSELAGLMMDDQGERQNREF